MSAHLYRFQAALLAALFPDAMTAGQTREAT